MRKLNLIINLSISILTSAISAEVNFCNASVVSDTTVTTLPDLQVRGNDVAKEILSAVPMSSITADHIRTAAITDISDAVRRLPGVTLRDYGGNGGMKTLSIRGLGSEHTSIVYDGIPLTDCQSGQIDLSRYSLNNINSLSLYSGDNDDIFIPARAAASASSLYISSFIPSVYEEAGFAGRAHLKVGSFGFYDPYVRLEYSNGKGRTVSINGEYTHADNDYPFKLKNGVITTEERRQDASMNSWHTEVDSRWKLKSLFLSGKAYYYNKSQRLPGPVVYYVSENDESLKERNFFGQLQLKGRMASRFSIYANAKFNWASSRYSDHQEIYPGGVLENYYIQRECYASAALLYTSGNGLSADYSADWIWNNLSGETGEVTSPYRNSILQSLALKYRTSQITVTGRALYSVYINGAKSGATGTDNHRLSPSINLSYQPVRYTEWFIRTSYKNIYRLPTFNELYFRHYGSINLNPETTEQFNLGSTYSGQPTAWWQDLSVTLDGYVNFVRNKIVAVPYNMFLWKMSNIGKVRVFGLDMTLSSTFNLNHINQLLLSATYSYQRAQPRTSRESSEWMKQVAYIPRNSGSGSISWINPWVNCAVHTTATGERFTTSSNLTETKIDGFSEFGLGLFRTFQLHKTEIEGRVDILNIFDTQYEIVARYPMPGRSWRFSVDLKF